MIHFRASMLALASLCLSVASSSAYAGAASASAPVSVSVTIMAPAAMIGSSSSAAGAATRPTQGVNTVRLDPSGDISVAGAGDGFSTRGYSTTAVLTLSGSPGTIYSLGDSLSFSNPGLTKVSATPVGPSGAIPSSGLEEIRYGVIFAMDSKTPVRSYAGTLVVTIIYN